MKKHSKLAYLFIAGFHLLLVFGADKAVVSAALAASYLVLSTIK